MQNNFISSDIISIITNYIPNYHTSILLKKKQKINDLIDYYNKKLNYYQSKLNNVNTTIMQSCEHSEIIYEYYYDYDGTQYSYICKFCKLIGPESWETRVTEYKHI